MDDTLHTSPFDAIRHVDEQLGDTGSSERLFGWQLDPLSRRMVALLPTEGASLWSQELDLSR